MNLNNILEKYISPKRTREEIEHLRDPSRPLIPERSFSDMMEYGASGGAEIGYWATAMAGRTMQAGGLICILSSENPREALFKGIMIFSAGTLINGVNKIAQYVQANYERNKY